MSLRRRIAAGIVALLMGALLMGAAPITVYTDEMESSVPADFARYQGMGEVILNFDVLEQFNACPDNSVIGLTDQVSGGIAFYDIQGADTVSISFYANYGCFVSRTSYGSYVLGPHIDMLETYPVYVYGSNMYTIDHNGQVRIGYYDAADQDITFYAAMDPPSKSLLQKVGVTVYAQSSTSTYREVTVGMPDYTVYYETTSLMHHYQLTASLPDDTVSIAVLLRGLNTRVNINLVDASGIYDIFLASVTFQGADMALGKPDVPSEPGEDGNDNLGESSQPENTSSETTDGANDNLVPEPSYAQRSPSDRRNYSSFGSNQNGSAQNVQAALDPGWGGTLIIDNQPLSPPVLEDNPENAKTEALAGEENMADSTDNTKTAGISQGIPPALYRAAICVIGISVAGVVAALIVRHRRRKAIAIKPHSAAETDEQ